MTLYGFARISTFDQRDTGLSIDAQKEKLIQAGVDPKNIYVDEATSGGIKEDKIEFQHTDTGYYKINININHRKEFRKMIQTATEGDTIIFLKWDRLSRSIIFTEAFIWDCERRGIKLQPLEQSKDRLTRRILQVIAEEEIENIISRVNSITTNIYEKGLYPYRACKGYDKNTRNKEGKLKYPDKPESSLIIIPQEAEIIKDIFKMKIAGKHYKEIAEKHQMDAKGVYNIIRNKTYMGMTSNGTEYKKTENVPAIVTDEEWNQANAK